MKVGIKDIAQKLGVSVAAVSLALNNKPGVSDETRAKVFEVARELEYSIDKPTNNTGSKVRFLRISRHGHILNNNHEHFIADYISGIMDSAHLHNMTVEIDSFDISLDMSEIIERIRSQKQIEGYVVLATELNKEEIAALQLTGTDMVFIDSYICNVSADFVTMNNMEAVFKVLEHFKANGYSRIGFFDSSVKTSNFVLREQAFFKGLREYDFKYNEDLTYCVDSTFEGAYQDMKKYLESGAELPEAAFACSDIIALGCIKALQEKGIRVPEDMAVVGFDNLPMSQMSSPSLSTIKVSKRQIGRMALDLLYLKMQHQMELVPTVSMIGVEFIERESSKGRVC